MFQGQDGKLTDFVSFYSLPSTIMHHPSHKSLRAAYSFYNAATKTPWVDLMQDTLIVAKNVSCKIHHTSPKQYLICPFHLCYVLSPVTKFTLFRAAMFFFTAHLNSNFLTSPPV